jgi:putative hydrolase of the HAD superfamily
VTILLLDVDGVLQRPRPDYSIAMSEDIEWRDGYGAFERDVFGDETYLRAMVGEGDVLTRLQVLVDRHASGVKAELVHDRWSSLVEVNTRLLDLLPRLDVTGAWLATNQDARRAAVVQTTYGGLGWCRGVLASCALGARKPDPEFYRRVLASLGARADACFVVDDKQACVDAAASVGVAGTRFVDNATLDADLRTVGLLTGP